MIDIQEVWLHILSWAPLFTLLNNRGASKADQILFSIWDCIIHKKPLAHIATCNYFGQETITVQNIKWKFKLLIILNFTYAFLEVENFPLT